MTGTRRYFRAQATVKRHPYCSTCQANPPIAKGECMTCYQYRRINGVQRPKRLARRQFDLNHRNIGRRTA